MNGGGVGPEGGDVDGVDPGSEGEGPDGKGSEGEGPDGETPEPVGRLGKGFKVDVVADGRSPRSGRCCITAASYDI
jgi:hypothetical protein